MKTISMIFAFTLLACALFTGCKNDDNPAGSGGGSTTYYGTFAGNSESGSMSSTFSSPPSKAIPSSHLRTSTVITVTATIKVQSGATVNLTGTYDTDTDSLKVSGGGYTFEGTFANGEISGNYTGPNGPGSFTITASSSGTVKVYCGQYTENSPGTHTGRINVVIDGTKITVLVRGGGDSPEVYKGTLNARAITIYQSGTSGTVLATGQLSVDGASMTGTYNSGDQQGIWSGQLCQ